MDFKKHFGTKIAESESNEVSKIESRLQYHKYKVFSFIEIGLSSLQNLIQQSLVSSNTILSCIVYVYILTFKSNTHYYIWL